MSKKNKKKEWKKHDQFCVWVLGGNKYPLATFFSYDTAQEWGREVSPYNYIIKKRKVKLPPFATKKEWKKADKEAEKLIKNIWGGKGERYERHE